MPRILLIEDDPDVRKSLRWLLTRLNFEVDEAGDGQSAIQQFRAQPADLVITDMQMPGVKGEAVISTIRELAPGTKIIAISGNLDFDLALQRGADRALMKPFSLDDLVQAVRGLLGDPRPSDATNHQTPGPAQGPIPTAATPPNPPDRLDCRNRSNPN